MHPITGPAGGGGSDDEADGVNDVRCGVVHTQRQPPLLLISILHCHIQRFSLEFVPPS